MPPPAPTELLNQDLGRLVSEVGKLSERFDHAVERLTDKIDLNNNDFHGFRIEVTKQISSLQTTIKIAGGAVTVLLSIAIYFSRNAYQTAFLEGERVGTIEAKIDAVDRLQIRFETMEKALMEHFKNPTQPANYRSLAPDQKPDKKGENPPAEPLPSPPATSLPSNVDPPSPDSIEKPAKSKLKSPPKTAVDADASKIKSPT